MPVAIVNEPDSKLWQLWRDIEPMRWFLDDTLRNPFIFRAVLSLPTTAAFYLGEKFEEPLGLVYAHSISPGANGNVAIILWDRRAYGRDDLLQLGLKAVAYKFQLHKFYAHIAAPNTLAHRLCRRIGFTKEGDLREALCYDGVWTDVSLYGLLAKEL
jgi:RimJ/RimL family protein N-acetyltransferase